MIQVDGLNEYDGVPHINRTQAVSKSRSTPPGAVLWPASLTFAGLLDGGIHAPACIRCQERLPAVGACPSPNAKPETVAFTHRHFDLLGAEFDVRRTAQRTTSIGPLNRTGSTVFPR